MPREARSKSTTGIYHIMVRGINRQNIFQDDEDKSVYLERILRYRDECECKLYAYCIMNNHVHFLMKEGKEEISTTMKKIGASYVYWYNWKYGRIGHLFQDRYKSEPIEEDAYFLTVLRYIHQNPLKIGLPIDNWTSYNDYIGGQSKIDVDFAISLFDNDIDKFILFLTAKTNDLCMDLSETIRITDNEAKNIIKEILGSSNYQIIQLYDNESRNTALKKMKDECLSIRQIERITGINRGIVLKA